MSLMTPQLGHRPIADIKAIELLAALKKVEAKGHLETARRMRSLAGRIFRYAIATGRAEIDPSSQLRGALIVPQVKHHSALLDEGSVGALLRAIDGYDGQPLTKIALKLTPHVFVRPGELRRAEWAEFDLAGGIWTIPAIKMKMREPHLGASSNFTKFNASLQVIAQLSDRIRLRFDSIGQYSTKSLLAPEEFAWAVARSAGLSISTK